MKAFIYISFIALLASCSKDSELIISEDTNRLLVLQSISFDDEKRMIDNDYLYSRGDTLGILIENGAFTVDNTSEIKYVVNRVISK